MVDHVESQSGAPAPERVVTVLAVSDSEDDHGWLGEIFRRSRWRILSARSCGEAFEILQSQRIPVVVCECALPDGSWKSLLNRFAQSADEPLLVVTSRQADDRLWAEVLNLGGYDVLSKPFDRAEVVRVISAAWLHWRQRRIAHAARRAAPDLAYRAAV
jgi:DNA-binding response OmpR family regulator